MVSISFNYPDFIYKILQGNKITAIQKLNKKWQVVYNKFSSRTFQEIPLSLWYKQGNPHGFKFLFGKRNVHYNDESTKKR